MSRVDLHDVEVEIKEGRRSRASSSGPKNLPSPTQYPLIGASISTQNDLGPIGTLGGYVIVDGEVMGLTSHHVAFGNRLQAFPTAEEEASGVTYTCLQPPQKDLNTRIEWLEEERCQSEVDPLKIDAKIEELRLWTPDRCVLGTVCKSSGIRARNGENYRCFQLDWALIKLDSARFPKQSEIVNEVCICCILTFCKSTRLIIITDPKIL